MKNKFMHMEFCFFYEPPAAFGSVKVTSKVTLGKKTSKVVQ